MIIGDTEQCLHESENVVVVARDGALMAVCVECGEEGEYLPEVGIEEKANEVPHQFGPPL